MFHQNKKQTFKKWQLLPVSWKYQAKEFFEKSTLHGVRYIAETNRPIYERIMWFGLTTIGTVITLVIILSLWKKFQTNPTITGLDTDFHNWDVPFPAVTLCPYNSVNKVLLDEYIIKNWGSELNEEKINYYEKFVTQISLLSYNDFQNISEFVDDKELPQDNLREISLKVNIKCVDLIYDCEWKDSIYDCCEGFLPVTTENGFCYSLNSEQAQLEVLGESVFPKVQYIYETDTKWSIVFNLNITENNPIKIYIHSSHETPNLDMDPQLIWSHQISKVFFSSKHTYTTDDARQLTIKQRRCIFHDERKLITHSKYSYTACMTQCRMEMAKEFCGCVPNFYKKISEFPYCNLKGLGCLTKHLKDLGRGIICPCELGCENTVYEVEKLVDAVSNAETILRGGNGESLEMGFVSWPMVRYKREVLFGWVDLLVSFGGIAGLFLGFSLLSGVEILYYFTMRVICMVYYNTEELLELEKEYGNNHYLNEIGPQEFQKSKKKRKQVKKLRNDEMYNEQFY